MKPIKFDALARFLAARPTRRQVLRALGGGVLANALGRRGAGAAACPSGVVCSAQCCPNASDICLAGGCTSCPSGVICSAQCCPDASDICQAGQCAAAATTTSAPSCVALGATCFDSPSCCAPYICREVCCGGKGIACSRDLECCPGLTCANGQCGCATCAQLGLECGIFDDPCTRAPLDCGTCDARQCLTCRHNHCVSSCDRFADQVCQGGTCCTPKTAATACAPAISCGRVPDGCGGTVSCGTCGPDQVCHQTGPGSAACCTPVAACPAVVKCGPYPDGCGGTLDCGACAPSRVCEGGTCVCPSGKCGPTCADTVCGSGTNTVCCGSGHECVNGGCFQITKDLFCRGCSDECGCAGSISGSSNYLCTVDTSNGCANGDVCPSGQACASRLDCVAPC